VIVVAALMIVLTALGGKKRSDFSIDIPTGAVVSVVEGGDGKPSVLSMTDSGGRATRHESLAEWRVKELDGSAGARRAFGSGTVSKFFNRDNLVSQTTYASYIAVMAVGMTAIIILAGIDLSIGSIYALAALLGAMALNWVGVQAGTAKMLAVGLAVCCGAGAVMGFLNGFASVALRVHPFVITLGAMTIYRGAVFVASDGQTIGVDSEALQRRFFKADIAGVYPVPTLIMLLVALIGVFVLTRTVFGRRIYAIGGNETAARYAGIPVGRVKVITYTILGALAGLAGLMYLGYYGAAENNAGKGYELKVIAAAVIGGASLSGGKGSALGAVLGAIMVQLIDNGLVILGIDQSYNDIVMGAAIIAAVVVDQTKSNVMR